MTEIPEHLLKRSRERRAAATGESADDGGAAASDAAPATSEAAATPAPAAPTGPAPRGAAPEPSAPKPPPPDPPYVAAAKSRRKIPVWAMATLSLLPVWAFMYVRALTEGEEVVEGPIGTGAEVYSNCASCHGAAGGGGVGYAFANGEVLATFPNIEDQIRYVYFGTEGYNLAGIDVYGNPDREGGAHVTGAQGVMPAFGGQLEFSEIVAVVCHERYTIAGADPETEEFAEEYEAWCSPEAPVYEAIESLEYDIDSSEEETFALPDGSSVLVDPIGPQPVPGGPPEATPDGGES